MLKPTEMNPLAAAAEQDHAAYGAWLAARASADEALARRLTRHCVRRDPPLVLAGAGPASLGTLSAWAERYRQRQPPDRLLVHHVGCTREARALDQLLHRLLSALRAACQLREPLPASTAARIELLPNWLARAAAGGRFVLVLTGLDALEEEPAAEPLAWLPDYLPPGIRLITTSGAGETLEVLRQRRWQLLAMAEAQARPALPAAGTELLRLLWAGRRGVEAARLPRQAETALAEAAAADLIYDCAGRWALAGPAVQDTVRRRLLPEAADRQAAYLQLLELYPQPLQAAALDALPWLLPASGHWEGLGVLLGSPRVLASLLQPGREEDLLACWRHWGAPAELAEFYCQRLPAWREQLEPEPLLGLLLELIRALQWLRAAEPALGPLLQAALELGEHLPELPRAAAQAAYAGWLVDLERPAEAEPLLRPALMSCERALGVDHPRARAVRHQLAAVLETRGELAAAETLYRQTLEGREASLGRHHVDLLPHLANLAAVRKALLDYDGARPLYQRALTIAEQSYGNAHPTTAACLDSLAGLLYAGHDYQQAEDLYQRALGLAETAFGPRHPATAASAHNLATVLDAREQYQTAAELFQQALESRRQALGEQHMDTAATLHNLAGALEALGDAAQAERLYRQAVAVWEQLVGPEHPATATSINNLADLLRDRGAYTEAEALYRRNLHTWQGLMGAEHPHTVMTRAELAALYADQGRQAEAEPLLRQAVEETGRLLGPADLLHINSVVKLGALLRDSGRRAEAVQLLRSTLQQVEANVSLVSPRLQKLRRHLAVLEAAPESLH